MAEDKERGGPESASRRNFIEELLLILGVSEIGNWLFGLQTPGTNASGYSQPQPTRYTTKKLEMTPAIGGVELNLAIEAVRHNGDSDELKCFAKWISIGDSYAVFLRLHASRFVTGVSAVILANRGAVEGDFRRDRLSAVAVSDDGKIQRIEPLETKVRTTDPYGGMTPQQTIEKFLREKMGGKWRRPAQ